MVDLDQLEFNVKSFDYAKEQAVAAQVVDRAFGKDYSETFYKTHEWRDTPVIVYHPSR